MHVFVRRVGFHCYYRYFGRYLHTGDFRFHEYMFTEYKYLYPDPVNNLTKEGIPKSIHIDELIFDNTFCDPVFKFPTRGECTDMCFELIDKNLPCEVYVSSYNAGKEELLIELSIKFNTRVWCSENRYKDMMCIGMNKYFTIDESEAWIFLNRLSDDEVVRNK